jgi:hypothetical protein
MVSDTVQRFRHEMQKYTRMNITEEALGTLVEMGTNHNGSLFPRPRFDFLFSLLQSHRDLSLLRTYEIWYSITSPFRLA